MKSSKQSIPAGKITLSTRPKDYIIAIVAVILVLAGCYPATHYIGYQAVGLIFLVVISLLSLILGRGAVFFAAILSSAVWNFFFIPPLLTFHIYSAHDLISVLANLMVALVGATLITRIRKSRQDLWKSREQLRAQKTFLESLNYAVSIKDVISRSQDSFEANFGAEIVIFLKEIRGIALGRRAFGNGTLFGDDTFESACRKFNDPAADVPGYSLLADPRGTFGVIGIRFEGDLEPPAEIQSQIGNFIAQVTSALEREISVDLAKFREITRESEKLFDTILNSVSHELRTPIAVLSAAVSNLQDPLIPDNPETMGKIIPEIEAAVRRLNFLVEKILDMSRIEAGRMKLNLQLCDPEDLIGMVLHMLGSELKGRMPELKVPENTEPFTADVSLLIQALVNIVHNAIVYTPEGTPVLIEITCLPGEKIAITVADGGPGVPQAALEKLFDKFYRVPGSPSGGSGLGLAISKAIVQAHHGTIRAENRPGGGLSVTLELPAASGDFEAN